jgi:type IV secretory pathway TraG/TraD family ATPase VirD4
MRDLSRFFGQVIFQKIVRAIFSRRVTRDTEPVTILADEFQELLAPDLAGDFERILTLARSQRVFLWALFQQVAQVEAVSPTLLRIMKTNSIVQVVFRSSAEDARAFSHILPAQGGEERDTEDFPDPRSPRRRTTAEEERRELVAQTPSLPDRVFWFWNRARQYPALLVKAPFVEMRALEASARSLPSELRDMATRGVLATTSEEIEAAEARRLPTPATPQHAAVDPSADAPEHVANVPENAGAVVRALRAHDPKPDDLEPGDPVSH